MHRGMLGEGGNEHATMRPWGNAPARRPIWPGGHTRALRRPGTKIPPRFTRGLPCGRLRALASRGETPGRGGGNGTRSLRLSPGGLRFAPVLRRRDQRPPERSPLPQQPRCSHPHEHDAVPCCSRPGRGAWGALVRGVGPDTRSLVVPIPPRAQPLSCRSTEPPPPPPPLP